MGVEMKDITPEDSVSPVLLITLSKEELKELEELELERAARQKKLVDAELARDSALAKLAKLGLTEDEAKAVIGF